MLARCSVLLLILALLAPTPILAQQTEPPSVIRSTTRLVQLNVIVRDKTGAVVNGLTQDDFTILDQGNAQEIAFFAVEDHTSVNGAKPLPPNTFSNRYDLAGQAPGTVTLILLDSRNSKWADIASAKLQVSKFLQQLHPQDRVAIYTLGLELKVLQDFTGDSSALVKAIELYRGSVASTPEPEQVTNSGTGVPHVDAMLEAARTSANNNFYTWGYEDRMRRTTAVLKAIADRLTPIPGRKNLVWLSTSFPIASWTKRAGPNQVQEYRSFQPELDASSSALLDANIAVYPIDPRGLITDEFAAEAQSHQSQDTDTLHLEFDTMNLLADSTGGRAFYNANDLAGSVRKAVDDGRLSYQLAYHPDHGQWDGKFRTVQVRLKRPGLQVQSRKGYFAVPEPLIGQDPQARQAQLESATKNSVELTNIGLSVAVHPETKDRQSTLGLAVNIATDGLALAEQDGHWKGAVDIVVVQRDAKGNAVDAHQWHWILDLNKAAYDNALHNGLAVSRSVPAKPDVVNTILVVRDSTSNAIGSLIIPVKKLAM